MKELPTLGRYNAVFSVEKWGDWYSAPGNLYLARALRHTFVHHPNPTAPQSRRFQSPPPNPNKPYPTPHTPHPKPHTPHSKPRTRSSWVQEEGVLQLGKGGKSTAAGYIRREYCSWVQKERVLQLGAGGGSTQRGEAGGATRCLLRDETRWEMLRYVCQFDTHRTRGISKPQPPNHTL